MATYAKITDSAPVPSYLTAGKEYLTSPYNPPESEPMAGQFWPNLFMITDDRGMEIVCRWSGCAHLKDYPWRQANPVVLTVSGTIQEMFDTGNPKAREYDERLIAELLPLVEQLRAGTIAGYEFVEAVERVNLLGVKV